MADPCGIIAIMTSPDGRVIATATDFDRSAPGGCKLWEGQMWRARDQVKWAAVRAYCSDVVVKAITSYTSTKIAEDLLSTVGGHRITYRSIGYPEDIQTEIQRS